MTYILSYFITLHCTKTDHMADYENYIFYDVHSDLITWNICNEYLISIVGYTHEYTDFITVCNIFQNHSLRMKG